MRSKRTTAVEDAALKVSEAVARRLELEDQAAKAYRFQELEVPPGFTVNRVMRMLQARKDEAQALEALDAAWKTVGAAK